MRDLSNGRYSHDEVLEVLHSKKGSREIRFRYDLLTKDEEKKLELFDVESGEIEFQAFNTIKRTARFKIKDTNEKIGFNVTRPTKWGDFGESTWENLKLG